jgi:hypothetical protein
MPLSRRKKHILVIYCRCSINISLSIKQLLCDFMHHFFPIAGHHPHVSAQHVVPDYRRYPPEAVCVVERQVRRGSQPW